MKEWGCVKGEMLRVRVVVIAVGAREVNATFVARVGVGCTCPAGVAGCSHQRTRVGGEVRGVGRLGCRGMYSRRFTRMMGSLATARLGSISSPTATRGVLGHADLRARSLVVSEPHAAVSTGARHRISPSRRP